MRVLLLMRGAPGCGKSTWIKQHSLERYKLCADDIRMQVQAPILTVDGGTAIDQSGDREVWATLFRLLELRMRNGAFTVIDATNSKTSEINRYKELCDTYRYRIFCVDFTDLPIDEVKRRNASREPLRRVPEEAIDKCYSRFATQKIPSGVKVIKPDALDQVWLKKFDMNPWKKIHVIGDLHGCDTALQRYFDDCGGFSDEEFYIFCGDYIDRGIENAQLIERLMALAEKKNVLLLEGNHERWLWSWANGCPAKSKNFEFYTRGELEKAELDKKSVRKFYRKLGQCAWFDYAGKTYLITHAGISTLPENLTLISTEQMIRGVGTYNEAELCDAAFAANTPGNTIQIHGHRNVKHLPVQTNDKCFNLEGGVEHGGFLRCVRLLPDGAIETVETKNNVYNVSELLDEPEEAKTKSSVGDLVLALRNNRFISEKQYGDISSFNFTKQAFYDKIWDEQTTKARGLYIDIPKQKIVARGYEKFFNINERPETKFDLLSQKLSFPVTAYVKENGFLGLVSYNAGTDELFITTKSSPDGDYAVWLRAMVYRLIPEGKLCALKAYAKEHNATFVFECVDMKNDPHVIDYPEDRLYLLDVVFNEINFNKLKYDELCALANDFGLRVKELACRIESWQDFFDWYYAVTDEDYLYHSRHIEGFVVEDAAGYMVKLKLAYYNFWKFMRSVAHEAIRKGYIDPRRTSALTTPLANAFYGWVRTLHDAEDVELLPKDIVTLRSMFLHSDAGKPFEKEVL